MTAPTPDLESAIAHAVDQAHEDALADARGLGKDDLTRLARRITDEFEAELAVTLAAATADSDASSRMHEETRALLDQALGERDQARETVTAAPHAPHCSSLIPVPDPPRYPCNCWKKEVN